MISISFIRKHIQAIRICLIVILIFIILAMLWSVAVYSDNDFISKWRSIYIETAMSTMTHQWLATAIIPQTVISEVMSARTTAIEAGMVKESAIPEVTAAPMPVEEIAETETPLSSNELLVQVFSELDYDTLPDDLISGNVTSFEAKDIEELGIYTTAGDPVWAIDVENGILIISVSGDGYQGKLAIVNDSSKVFLGRTQLSSRGQTVVEMCGEYDAILGINANGFYDPDGLGYGNEADSLVISEGVLCHAAASGGYYQICGYDYEDNFRVGYGLNISELRDAAQFYPTIIVNGEDVTSGATSGFGIQPRTVIGQTANKQTLFLVIDGRQLGYSLGTTVVECADILIRYDCYNAMCMDGGSSSSMVYDEELITSPSTSMVDGRYVPTAWLVSK